MGDKSKIEWTDATWNPIRATNKTSQHQGWFCVKVSPECKNCYAERMNIWRGNGIRYAQDQRERVQLVLVDHALQQPLFWTRPRMVFPCSMTDLFAEFVPDAWITAMYDVMDQAHQQVFQVLTKRPARRRDFLSARYSQRSPAPNIWEGVSCGLQKTADEWIPLLLETPAAVRWISAEPLLGAMDLWRYLQLCDAALISRNGVYDEKLHAAMNRIRTFAHRGACALHWLVAGGESGPGARPMHPDWARSLREQCQAAGVPFFFKQWGAWAPLDTAIAELVVGHKAPAECIRLEIPRPVTMHRLGKHASGRELDDRTWDEYPVGAVAVGA